MFRKQFLATGLAPVDQAEDKIHDCPVCSEESKSPVSLPCHSTHIFCRECIQTWLTADNINTCPTCRFELFDLRDELDEGDEEADQVLVLDPRVVEGQRLIEQAVGIANFHGNADQAGQAFDSPTWLHTFEQGPIAHDAIMAGLAFATGYMQQIRPTDDNTGFSYHEAESGSVVAVRGRGRVNVDTLMPRFIAMAHLLPALAQVLGRRYTRQQMDDWHLLMCQLGQLLAAQHGGHVDVRSTPGELRLKLQEGLSAIYSDIEEIEALWPEPEDGTVNARRAELDAVLDYVSFLAWREQQDFEVAKRVERERRKAEREARRLQRRCCRPRCAVQ